MKTYLVAYDTGGGIIKKTKVNTEDDYIPVSDNCKLLKELVCEKKKPKETSVSAAPSNCGGYLRVTEYNEIKPDDLRIIAVSNLCV